MRKKKEVCGPWINAHVTAVVLLLHKALHSQSHRAYNSSQWVGEASFKPWRKSSYLPTPPPFLSLTHRHGQGPIREGCSMQYASHIALQHKQMELHLSNVGQQCKRKKPGKKCLVHIYEGNARCMYVFFIEEVWGKLMRFHKLLNPLDISLFKCNNYLLLFFNTEWRLESLRPKCASWIVE